MIEKGFCAALQSRSNYNSWESLSPPEGLALNSKWYEAEKYICNPLSGEVPMECFVELWSLLPVFIAWSMAISGKAIYGT